MAERAEARETCSDLLKVCNFLQTRGVTQEIIESFRYEKMDVEAIMQAKDNELVLLGLDKKGDILSLRNFVQKLSKESSDVEKRSKKMSLLHEVLENGKQKKSLKQQKDGKVLPKMRKVQLGWLHFDAEKQCFVSVRMAKGGGTREVEIELNADKDDIIGIAKSIFFTDGNSNFGPEQLMTFGRANFQHKDISTIKLSGVHLAFTLQHYVEKCKMCRVRLYLTSKINTLDDVSLLKPADHLKPASTSKLERKESGLYDDETKSQTLTKLEERRKIISEQDADYEESLATDKAKREKLMKEPVKQAKNTTLYMSEAISTPRLEDEEVTFFGFGINEWEPLDDSIYFMHPISETIPEQLLDDDESVIGGHEQESYVQQQLTKTDGRKRTADGGRLFRQHYLPLLARQQSPVLFGNIGRENEQEMTDNRESRGSASRDSSGSGSGSHGGSCGNGGSSSGSSGRGSNSESSGGSGGNESNGRSSGGGGGRSSGSGSNSGSSGGSSGNGSNGGSSGGSSGSRSNGESSGGSSGDSSSGSRVADVTKRLRTLRVKRSLVLQDLVTEFLDGDIMTCELKVIMVDGHGKDERGEDLKGIYRDALSSFWQEFYVSCTLGERGRVPSIRHDFQSDTWTAIARIIVKGYEDLGYFPVLLSKAFVISTMLGEKAVSDDILLHSFKQYLSKSEEQVVCEALGRPVEEWDSDDKDDEDLLELLDRFGCRSLPTKENMKSLILEVAHKEIIQKAQYVADCWHYIFRGSLAEGKLSTLEGVCSVYQSLEPTTKKVLRMLCALPGTNAERSALDYLKRFIRGLEISQLKSFLMFTTGADAMCVSCINVDFTKLEGLGRRPIAHTCGCVLELPSTYDTYAQFRAEFINVLAKEKWQNDIM